MFGVKRLSWMTGWKLFNPLIQRLQWRSGFGLAKRRSPFPFQNGGNVISDKCKICAELAAGFRAVIFKSRNHEADWGGGI
jgi:hypothetical protein